MAAPTSPTVTQNGESAQISVGWSHSGSEDRFEVRFRRAGTSDTWERAILAPKARFGSSSPYAFVTGSRPGYTWNVRAFTAAGAPTSAVEDDFDATAYVDGTWLLPVVDSQVVSGKRAWVGRDSGSGVRPQTRAEAYIPSRQEAISTPGALHLEYGSIEGVLMERHSLIADAWLARLENLIVNQSKYDHILYVSNRKRLKVELYGDVSNLVTFMSGDAFDVSVNYRQLA